jgi:hypothetical protein
MPRAPHTCLLETTEGRVTQRHRFFRGPHWHPPARFSREKVSRKATNKVNLGAKCETCGKPLGYRGIGRPRKFCSDGCYRVARQTRRRVVPRFVYDHASRSTVPNPDPRPKSKVR